MVGLESVIAGHNRIALDTSIFVYSIQSIAPLALLADQVMNAIGSGRVTGATSIVTIAELLVKPLQTKRYQLAHEYETFIRAIPNLRIADVDAHVARQAASLRALYPLRTPDALHVATGLVNGATAFVTNDVRLRQVAAINVIVLGDYVEQASEP